MEDLVMILKNKLHGPEIHTQFHVKDGWIDQIHLAKSASGFSWTVVFEGHQNERDISCQIRQWMEVYVSKKEPETILPISFKSLPPFTQLVLHALQRQKFGERISYKTLASKACRPQAVRAAGTACGRNPCPLVVPCHRVISSDGSLGGFSAGLDIKSILLEFEKA